MKKTILPVLALFLCLSAFSQHMLVKRHNYTTFSKDVKKVSPVLEKKSTADDKKHPEYGIVPFNAYCSGCTELIDKRTINSRYYISPDTEAKFFIQKSYFPLHYKKSADDVWRTIDFRLRPDANQPGVYTANNQPTPTKCDLNRQSTSFKVDNVEFEFNHNLTLYFFDEDKAYLKPEKGDYSNYTIGDEGLMVKNLWQGVDMEQTFRAGEIETNYIISKPLQLPIDNGYMVIEDHFTLPEGFTITESETGRKLDNGYFSGDYKIGNGKGTEILYSRPAYFDATAIGMLGIYNLKKNGNECTLQVMVPVKWLNSPGNTYPLYIDPFVTPDSAGANTIKGNYQSTGQPPFQYAFTDKHFGSCNDTIAVPTPARTTLVEAYVAVEYQLTYNPSCGTSPNYEATPFCTFHQVTQQVINNLCGTTSGTFQCNPALPPFTGTCTTDSDLVAGAHPLRINNFAPDYLSCIVPQCAPDTLSFTLENQDSTCDDVCGYLCARGHLYSITLEGYYLIGEMSAVGYPPTQTTDTTCAGPINFIAQGKYGVPPYRFLWTKDGGNTYDTTYTGAYTLNATDTNGYSLTCVVIDTCGDIANTTVYTITVLNVPPANAGPDKFVCEEEGGTLTIGGNPTTPAPNTVVGWSAENATALSWLNDTTSANPTVTVPVGLADTVYYVVTTSNSFCTSTDTVLVYSLPNPTVTIDSGGPTAICPGQSVPLIALATGGVTIYAWSNGGVDSVTSVNSPGSYNVTVTDPAGCKDTSNSITVTNIGPPVFAIFPDTTIHIGDSVALYADIQLTPPLVDSFFWSPAVNLSCFTCNSPVASPIAPQEYYLTVYRAGCSVTDSLLIQVLLPTNFYIPNAFTPGRAGDNDQFYIFCQSGVTVISFEVFDRTGEKVHDGTYPWDGSYRGKPAPEGVYVYTFSLGLFGNPTSVFRKGSVTLIR